MPPAKFSLLFVTGSRADFGLLHPLAAHLQRRGHVVRWLVTGMHTLSTYGSTIDDVRQSGQPIAGVVPIRTGQDMTQSVAREIEGIRRVCRRWRPDGIIILGDRDEPFAASIVALHERIPLVHISGGDTSYASIDHYLRNAITVFSSLHLTQTKLSRANVIRLGATPITAFTIGSLGLENLSSRTLWSKAAVATYFGLDPHQPWWLIVHHPATLSSVSSAKQVKPLMGLVPGLPGEKIIIYPNSDAGSEIFIRSINSLGRRPDVHILRNTPRLPYLSLFRYVLSCIGNTSSGLTEGGFLKIPFILVGDRQAGRERGANVISVGYDQPSIRRGIRRATNPKWVRAMKRRTSLYRGGPVAARAATQIEKFLSSHA